MRTIRTPKRSRLFLAELAEGASVDDDPDFSAAWEEAIEIGTDALEDECWRRAMTTSDRLLLALLRARRPAYRPPPHAMFTVDASLMADVEKARRIAALSDAELQAEIEGIEARRVAAAAARAEVEKLPRTCANGADH
jgi:hypothetical protein